MGSGVNNVYFVPGDYVTLPKDTTRIGYTFNNWYNTPDVNGKLVPDGVFEEAADVIELMDADDAVDVLEDLDSEDNYYDEPEMLDFGSLDDDDDKL